MNDCIFCKVIAREFPSRPVYEDDQLIVIPDIHPQAQIHLLVVPKKHIEQFTDASDELFMHMGKIIKQVIAKEGITNYRLVANGKGAALIDHLHIHILGGIDKMRKL